MIQQDIRKKQVYDEGNPLWVLINGEPVNIARVPGLDFMSPIMSSAFQGALQSYVSVWIS